MSYWEEEYFEPGIFDAILAEALDKCKMELKEEVKAYIEKNSDELKKARECIAKQSQKIKELQEQALGIDEMREQVKSELLRAVWDDVKPGDCVWVIHKKNKYKKCERCKGKREVQAVLSDGVAVKATCPDCNYEGLPDGVEYSVCQQRLEEIKIIISKSGGKYYRDISLEIAGVYYKEYGEGVIRLCKSGEKSEAYRTKEEAEAEVRRRESQEGEKQ